MSDKWKRWRVYMDELEDLLRWTAREIDAAELSLWSAVSTPESLVAGKSVSCVELSTSLCAALFAPGNGPLRLFLNVPAVDAKEWEGTLYTHRALPGQLYQACSQFAAKP